MADERPALLLTRPQAQAEAFAAECAARLGPGVEIVVSPILEIRYLDVDVDLDSYAGVVATSAHGIEALARRADLAGRVAWCIGDRTASVAEGYGMRAVSAGGNAADLVALLLRDAVAGTLLYSSGVEVRVDMEKALGPAGPRLRRLVCYEQRPAELSGQARSLLRGARRVVLPVFSPRSAALLGAAAREATAPLQLVALSDSVADAWTGPQLAGLTVAAGPTSAAVLDTIARACDGATA